MCTAAAYKTKDFYFGRTLDNDFSYAEEITVTPRNFPFGFLSEGIIKSHYAVMGVAYVPDDFPLYYDAVNEKGLCMAGLNFVGNAFYNQQKNKEINLAQFELLPYILCRCATVDEAVCTLRKINITAETYGNLPAAELHWMIADKNGAVTVEFVREGLRIYDNPVGILTNNPPFNMQTFNLNNFMRLSSVQPENTFSERIALKAYSRGMGAIGLPGDASSQSRFVRAAFVKNNSVSGESEEASVNQFFHILGSVEQQRGCCAVENGGYEITVYTSCCNADRGIYYYTTYENHSVTAVEMHREDLDSSSLIRYPLVRRENIVYVNR